MTGLIITGGTIEKSFARDFLKGQSFDRIIAVDGGLAFLEALGLKPDAVVGDFDTIDPMVLEGYRKQTDITFEEHKPEKDETDTELAIGTAIKAGCKSLVFLGATGGRMDHAIGNLHLLYACLTQGVQASIVDEKNRITVLEKGRDFFASQTWGNYISFLPLTEEVLGITLTGFKYPLFKKNITIGTSLCISNELIGEKGAITFDSGVLICVESHD